MEKVEKSLDSLRAGDTPRIENRLVKVVSAALFGAVCGGVLGFAALKSIRPLARTVWSSESRLSLVLAVAGLGGTGAGLLSIYLTRPRQPQRPDPEQQEYTASEGLGQSPGGESSENEPTGKSCSSSPPEEPTIEEKEFREADAATKADFENESLEDAEVVQAAVTRVKDMLDQATEALGEEAAQGWLVDKAGTVHTLLNKITIALPSSSSAAKPKPAQERLHSLERTINTINELGRPVTKLQLQRVMRNYQALVELLGEEVTAQLVGRTYPILGVADAEVRRAVIETPYRELEVVDYVDAKFEYLRRLRLPTTQQSIGLIDTNLEALKEGWHHDGYVQLMTDAFKQLLRVFGDEEQVLGLLGDTFPVTFELVPNRGRWRVNVVIDEKAVEEYAAAFQVEQDAKAEQVPRDPREDEVKPEAVSAKWAELPALEGEERVETEVTPIPRDLWLFALGDNDRWKVMIEKHAEYENPDLCLDANDFPTVRSNTRHLRKDLGALVDEALVALPEGYAEPIKDVADRLSEQLDIMHRLAKKAMGRAATEKRAAKAAKWELEQKAVYDAARNEAKWCLTELKNTLLLVEQKIGVDSRYCELLTDLATGIVSSPPIADDRAAVKEWAEEKLKHRENLRVDGERIRDFWADHKSGQQRLDVLPWDKGGSTEDGGEGSMEDLLESSYKRLQREGLSHELLHIQIRGKEWPEGLPAQENWVPVSFSLLTREESGGARATDGVVAMSQGLGGQHFVTYVESAEGETVRCDNVRRDNQVRVLSDAARRDAPGQLYVHASVIEQVRPALADAASWSTLRFQGNNCWISSTMMLLAAHHQAYTALTAEESSESSSS